MTRRIRFFMDWFCCAGVGAEGYFRAFEGTDVRIIGVDKDPQPNYPYAFIQWDALDAMDMLLGGLRWKGIGLSDVVA